MIKLTEYLWNNLDPRGLSAPALGLYTCIWPLLSNIFPSETAWPIKAKCFSETIVVNYIKVGRCSQLNEYMKLYEYQRSRSFIDLDPNHSDSIFLNFFSSITADFNISSALRWAIQDQWSSGLFLSVLTVVSTSVFEFFTDHMTYSVHIFVYNFIRQGGCPAWSESSITETSPYKSNPRFAPNI